MNILFIIIVSISLLYESYSNALVVGSNSTVSIVTTCTVFPAADSDNTILGFTWLKGGYTLEDETTSCTFDAVYPISGTVNLNGGTLYLLQDMILANPTQLNGLGTIIGNGHSIEFCETITALPSNLKLIKDLNVFFDGDIVVTGTLIVQGNCLVNAANNMLEIADNVNVVIDANSTLAIHNARLENVCNNLGCVADTSHIILQDVLVCLTGDSHFIYGDIRCENNVRVLGSGTLWYDSTQPLYIDDEANLSLDGGMTFKIGRKIVGGQDPIKFYDDESVLSCGECNLVITSSGIMLNRGRIEFLKNVNISTEGTDTTHGIILGDGISEEEDITVYLGPGSNTISSAVMTYNNVAPNKFYTSSPSASFIRTAQSYFYVAKDFIYPSGDVIFEVTNGQHSQTLLAEGKELYYNNMHLLIPGMCDITYYASRTQDYYCFLNGNTYIYMTSGVLTDQLWISNLANLISGNGDVAGAITLTDRNSQLILNLVGSFFNTISLNGGTIKLNNDISITTPNCFITTGTIDLDQYAMKFNYSESTAGTHTFDCPINWIGNNGSIDLFDKTTLDSVWTISGEVTINGNWNALHVGSAGKLKIESGAHLTLKNMTLNLTGSDNIVCMDNSCEIILDNAHWIQAQDFTFTTGSLIFKNDVRMSGQGAVFTYQSTQTSTIEYDSSLVLDYHLTYSYAPIDNSTTLMQFRDSTSQLRLNNSILYLVPGLNLLKGQLFIASDSKISALADGLTLGDQTSINDMLLIFKNRSKLLITEGKLNYKNINEDSLQMNNDANIFFMRGTRLNVYENMILGDESIITFDGKTQYAHVEGKQIIGPMGGVIKETII